MTRSELRLLLVGALGLSGLALLLPNPFRRWLLAQADRLTDEYVTAALAAWSDPAEVFDYAQA